MIRVADETQVIQCPYERSHQILKSRFQVHIGRCRRNHKNVPKEVCPFNVTHIVNRPELEWHISNCFDRRSFEHKCIETPRPQSNNPPPPALKEIETSENWDDEPDVPSYNPQAYAENALVIRNLQGATPSERKLFRQQERLRIIALQK